MKIFLTGANGLLGTAMVRELARHDAYSLVATDRAEVDITNADATHKAIVDARPDWVINCAAFTRVDDCETNEALACDVNGEGAGNLAAAAAHVGAGLVHISTDYIFDGTATSPIPVDTIPGSPEQLSTYGRSKLLGEQRVRSNHPSPTIVRTAWLYGHDGPCFPNAITRLATEGKLRKVVHDQRGSPTFANDLADGIIRLIHAKGTGNVHLVNDGQCTWFEFANEILRLAGIDCPIEPCTTAEFPRPAKRPAYSVLDLSRYESLTTHRPRSWQAAIAAYFDAAT